MHVYCENCGSMIAADDVNLVTSMAKCRACNAVFRLPDGIFAARGEEAWEVEPLPEPRRMVPRPEKVTVTEVGSTLVMERRWFSWVHVFMAFFSVIWWSFLVVWYGIAFTSNVASSPGGWLFLVFPLLHVAAGVWVGYMALTGFVNRTRITVDGSEVSVRHFPLPWPGNRVLRPGQVKQLYCDEQVNRGKNGTTITYRLKAVLSDGRTVALLSGLPDREVAQFMEHQLEQRLEIEDRPVAGEMAK